MKNAYVIVDGYGSGGMLVDSFRKKIDGDSDTAIIHVLSTPVPFSKMPAIDSSKYDETIMFDGMEQVIDALSKYKVIAVLAGQEPGVELADKLSEKLGLQSTNGTEMSTARRNKYDMIKAVTDAGLNAPKFIKSKDLSEILDWVQKNTKYPVVIKALRSAGTDGVYISSNENELRAAFEKLINSESIYDEVNNEILVESFLDGKEHVVNAVSLDGEHYVTDVWMYQKKFISGHGNIYDREMLLPADLPEVQELISYNAKVLDALGIKNGPSHAEIMYTSTGPALVEVGARISGVVHPILYNSCVGHNQVDLTIDCYSDPENFMKTVSAFPYAMKKHAMIVNLTYEGSSGKIERIDEEVLEQIKTLKSVVAVVIRVHEGDTLNPTRTLINSPARIFMGHENEEQLQEDYETIQHMKRRLFRIIVQAAHRPASLVESSARPSSEIIQSNADDDMIPGNSYAS
jgi:biotin carboxylase